MKRTYTPSIAEIDRQHGERYYTVSVGSESALQFGTLADIISTMDATIYGIDEEADPADYSARISYAGRNIVILPDCSSPYNARVCPQPAGDTYEVRGIDAWADLENAWAWNNSYYLGTFTTMSDPARALRRYLKTHHGITFYRGRTATEYDGDVYEIVDRATRQPLFAAIPQA